MDESLALEGLSLTGRGQTGIRGAKAVVKRAMDIAGALIAIPFFAPVMVLAAVLVKLDSRGPALFVQDRAGKADTEHPHGKPFKIYKLRTMVANAEERLVEIVDLDALDEPAFKIKDDPRVTRVGRLLRRWSIDELPQLLNVLKGEMSLVGPRPEDVRVVRYYSPWHQQRLRAKPGLTGPAQVAGRGRLSLSERVRIEVDYMDNYSLWRDIEIMLKTIPAVIRGDGSY